MQRHESIFIVFDDSQGSYNVFYHILYIFAEIVCFFGLMQHVFWEGKVPLESLQSMPSIFWNGLATANRMGNWQKRMFKDVRLTHIRKNTEGQNVYIKYYLP